MSDSSSLAELAATIPFATTLGIELVRAGPEEVVATMPWSEDKTTIGGRLHGGALMALADNAGAVCAFCNLPAGATTSTIESKTNFFRGVSSGTVTATSRPLHVGSTTIVVRTDLADGRGKPVATVTQTQIVLPPG
ncbi:MAG: PaaI family thioesterase [Acidimicrobiales bacterium]